MTKNNKILLDTIKNADLKFDENQLKFITDLLETAGQKPTKNPNIFNDDGQEMKFCSRHLQYELLSEFTAQKSGKIETCCDIALKQWRQYDKELKILEKLNTEILAGDAENIAPHFQAVQDAKDLRGGSYEYPQELAEEIVPAKPKRNKK